MAQLVPRQVAGRSAAAAAKATKGAPPFGRKVEKTIGLRVRVRVRVRIRVISSTIAVPSRRGSCVR